MAIKAMLITVIVIALMVPSIGSVTTDLETEYVPLDTGAQVDIISVYANQPPVADAGGPYYGDEGSTIQLDGSGTYDPDGDALIYYWDLDEDGLYDDSTQINPSYTWSEDGSYIVRLWVYDGEYFDTDIATVDVENLAPDIYSSSYVYTLTQGNYTQTIPAVERPENAASFYNYYSQSSHTGFETAYESKVFLYRDITTNEVSLFFTHDIDNSPSQETRVDFDLSGIPPGAYVAQSDDVSHGWDPPRTQEFSLAYPDMEGHWLHYHNTDGGVLSGLPTDSSWAITITPLYWYNINNWVYHYATGGGITLEMNTPVAIAYQAQTEPTTLETDEGTAITIGAFARDWGVDDEPLDYQIQWNDPGDLGATSSGTTPWDTLFTAEYTYYDDGPYYPLLTVTDSDGATDTLTFTVLVNNIAPGVDAGLDLVVDEGSPLNFSGTFSDPGAYDTHTASWNWGDGHSDPGSISEENMPPYSTGIVTGNHIFLDDGTYNVILEVQDDDGGTGQDALTVAVSDLAPSAEYAWSPSPLDEGSPVHFTDLSSSYPDDMVSWSWDFGGLGSSTLQNPQFTFMDDGVYTVTLTVTDDDGSTDAISHDVAVLDLAPAAEFSWSPEPQDEGSLVQFTDLSVSYPDLIVGYVWDFGDGGTSNQTAPSHMYGDNGIYPVTLVVTDDDGSIDTISYTITIVNVAPDVEAGADQLTDEGTTISLLGYFSDPGWFDTHSATIDWGDGTLDVGVVNGSGGSGTVYGSHAYGDNGAYTVIVTVTDDDGGVGYDTLIITVNNVAPAVEALSDIITDEGALISLDLATFTDPGWLDTHSAAIDWGDGTLDAGIVSGSSGSGTVSGSHTYGDNGIYTVTVTVTDDDMGVGFDTLEINVNNVAPTIVNIEAYMHINFTLRVAGEKWHSITMYLYEDGSEMWTGSVTREPGDPDEQTAIINNVKVDMTKTYTALVDYMPNDPMVNGNVWGGNPVWIIMTFEDGSETWLHHTFNVRQSDWDSDQWNHIDPWEVDFASCFGGHNITFEATATDPGSDDLTFLWDFGDSNSTSTTYFNNGMSPDPYPSPEINPMTASDSEVHNYPFSGTYTVTLTVTDDDGGTFTITMVIEVTII